MTKEFDDAALEYHRHPTPGKIQVTPTKPLATQRDLALAYSPGVAAACNVIANDPNEAASVTARGNLVGVISNGTAVLGLGNIGPLAAKPVMEGKGVLFKKFAGIDVFDIEIDQLDVDKIVETIVSLEPTFGGINLEDIKAPECFEIERRCRELMNIPVFHDDQHGTAIVAAAAIHNGLRYIGKNIADVVVATSGGGAAGIACLNLLVNMGLKRENIYLCDRQGVVTRERKVTDPGKKSYEQDTDRKTLADAVNGADVFLGLSAAGLLKPDMVKTMADHPLILALANPDPEIMPDEALEVRPDAIVCTGRSDFPNQVNNVLCFPFIFRGALDVGATTINEDMKIAVVQALGDMTHVPPPEVVARAYPGQKLSYGPEYLIPKPFDPRLITEISIAVAQAAMDSGVATRPIEDMEAYRTRLNAMMYRSGSLMSPIFEQARQNPQRIIYAEGEEIKVLRGIEEVLAEGIAKPIVVGRTEVIKELIQKHKLKLSIGDNIELIDLDDKGHYDDYSSMYLRMMQRHGITPRTLREVLTSSPTVVAALAVQHGDADAMICGTTGCYRTHLKHISNIIGCREGVSKLSAISALILNKGTFFLADTHVNYDPTPEELCETTFLATDFMRHVGLEPKVAMISHSNFGEYLSPSALKMREALKLITERAPDLEVEGEMRADLALAPGLREEIFPDSRLKGMANLLILPNLDTANSTFNMVKYMADGVAVSPILMGTAKPCHILTASSASTRRILNMSALAAVDAQYANAE
jgi:malate dehydrogenase (oxaloacetate-decarboxylating)(NADP+)